MQCPLCGTENDHLSIHCVKCRSFLQPRVPNIDLFPTLWKLIEKPRIAFKEIALAEHKNYSVTLFSILGIQFTSILFSLINVGEYYDNLIEVLTRLSVIGIVSGLLLSILLPLLHILLGKLFGFKASYRNALALLAYALTPAVYALFFLLPIKLLAFGLFYFTVNPHPTTLNSSLYYSLCILECLFLIWGGVWVVVGTTVTYQISVIRAFFVNFLTFILGFGVVYYNVVTIILKIKLNIL